jgi:hypothetical protein
MNVEDEIFVNQLAQKVIDMAQGLAWFARHGLDEKRSILRNIYVFVQQAHPTPDDARDAISSSRLKPTLTPCVLLAKPDIGTQLAKMASLPERELQTVFTLVVGLLGAADARRRTREPLDTMNHWWHRDLSNPAIVNEIVRQRSEGKL